MGRGGGRGERGGGGGSKNGSNTFVTKSVAAILAFAHGSESTSFVACHTCVVACMWFVVCSKAGGLGGTTPQKLEGYMIIAGSLLCSYFLVI